MVEGKDFFISYTGKDRGWAEWIAWLLEEAGYSTLIQAWDFRAASNFVLKMQKGTAETTRTIAVITPSYFESVFTNPEWASAFASDPASENGKLIPVRVADFSPSGLFKAIVYIDLVSLEESSAKQKLIESIKSIVTGKRLKPESKPVFPGTKLKAFSPPFPGTSVGPKFFINNLPFGSNPFFIGRGKMLQDIYVALRKNAAAAITQPQAVHGLGGVGKTQLAIEYAWQHQADYGVALWVAASSSRELQANVAALSDVLHLPEAEVKEQDIKIKAVVDWLHLNQRWLLIFDNVDSKEAEDAVARFLPHGLQGHILVTSRRSDWPVNFSDVEVSVLPETAGKEFLLKRTQKTNFMPGNDADALAVATELGCLPLALEQAAAYILKHRITFTEYKKSLEQSRRRLLEFPSQGGTGYQQTVATTWLITEPQLSHIAIAILQLAAFFSPFDIPREIFTNSGEVISNVSAKLMKGSESADQLSKEQIEDALAELHEHSLIKLEPHVFSCHRLLQAVLVDRLEAETKKTWLEAGTFLLADAAKTHPPQPTNWPFWVWLRPQIEEFLHHIEAPLQIPPLPLLMSILADYYDGIGSFALAESLLRKAIIFISAISDNTLEIVKYKQALAQFLCNGSQLNEAETICHELIDICQKSNEVDAYTFSAIVSVLAEIMKRTDRFDAAEKLCRTAIKIVESDSKAKPIHLAGPINNLADLLTITRRFSEAEKEFHRSLAILEEHEGERGPTVATVLFNLARCLHERGTLNPQGGSFAEAEAHYRRALAIDEAIFGTAHPVFARDANNLGWLLHDMGKLDEAEVLLRQSLKIEESKRDANHPHIATVLGNLGRLLTSKGHYDEALIVLRRSADMTLASFGKGHHEYAIKLTNLAMALVGCGRDAEAETCFQEVIKIDEKCFGSKHLEVGQDLWNLGAFFVRSEKYLDAEGFLRRSSNIFKQSLGKEHPRTQEILAIIEKLKAVRAFEALNSRAGEK